MPSTERAEELEPVDDFDSIITSRERPGSRDVSRLRPLYRRVAMLKAADMSSVDIARWLECSELRVKQILSDPRVQKLILQLSAQIVDDLKPKIQEVNEMIAGTLGEAFECEVELMRRTRAREGDDAAEKLCFSISKDILDRGGAAAPKRLETKNLSLNMSADNLATIMDALQEMDQLE